jgi:hypothetical protein
VYGFDCLYWRSLKVVPIASAVVVLAEVVFEMVEQPGFVFVMALEVEGRDEVLCAACLAEYGVVLIFFESESAYTKLIEWSCAWEVLFAKRTSFGARSGVSQAPLASF